MERSPDEYQEALIAKSLSHPWAFLSSRERREGVLAAYVHGGALAEATHADGEEAYGDCLDFVRATIRYCHLEAKVINDVELALWYGACDEGMEDQRLTAFAAGFRDRRRMLESR